MLGGAGFPVSLDTSPTCSRIPSIRTPAQSCPEGLVMRYAAVHAMHLRLASHHADHGLAARARAIGYGSTAGGGHLGGSVLGRSVRRRPRALLRGTAPPRVGCCLPERLSESCGHG